MQNGNENSLFRWERDTLILTFCDQAVLYFSFNFKNIIKSFSWVSKGLHAWLAKRWLAKKRFSGLAAVFCGTAHSYLWPLWCPGPSSWWRWFPTRTGSLTSVAGGGASRKAAKAEEKKTKRHQKTSMRESHNGVNILHIDLCRMPGGLEIILGCDHALTTYKA